MPADVGIFIANKRLFFIKNLQFVSYCVILRHIFTVGRI
ncbi:hypothetical protein MHA_0077 [Mannheimia haemolytica PHL213]|nr:hypothetical protein MHH_c26350 [Mannheimia haemolytica M42548]EDN73073.1 hypothetical protein MHA_0077 [Mannheimia haemolytica PHL213]EEY09529.1 hypothetical protein COI_1873 [Mannheimia haemolytica serotype A2 str. OVINE]EEY13170.1 hypothetical protein COK_0776 [Mannheimia haemolytica serotype A2 str. BOVINE]